MTIRVNIATTDVTPKGVMVGVREQLLCSLVYRQQDLAKSKENLAMAETLVQEAETALAELDAWLDGMGWANVQGNRRSAGFSAERPC